MSDAYGLGLQHIRNDFRVQDAVGLHSLEVAAEHSKPNAQLRHIWVLVSLIELPYLGLEAIDSISPCLVGAFHLRACVIKLLFEGLIS